ncbi:MAG: Squalene/phytoene synthase [Gemmatimonadetes bacterium]|jgi:farnesyl-diphosphate farnesyltransferase|nr:Squalene/phytoene synthase [Gemmatimonadota bacterium]
MDAMTQGDAARLGEAERFGREVLPAVSRTFALSIRVLPGTLGRAVLAAYLLCRIADTLEDEPVMPAPAKAALLDALQACFDDAAAADAFPQLVARLAGEPAHVRLTRHADLVFVLYRTLPAGTRTAVRRWVGEMITGMRKFVLRYPHGIRIQSVEEYREYCYYVAGTVGYLLTDLWHEHAPSIGARRYEVLRERCRAFAEALQTVNILKDVATDAEQENSIYIPEELLRAHGSSHAGLLSGAQIGGTRTALQALVELAWRDLEGARSYLLLIPRRAVSIRLFCLLPLLFAHATLRDLTRTPQAMARRDVVKISRREVKSLTVMGFVMVLSNRGLAWLAGRAGSRPVLLPMVG